MPNDRLTSLTIGHKIALALIVISLIAANFHVFQEPWSSNKIVEPSAQGWPARWYVQTQVSHNSFQEHYQPLGAAINVVFDLIVILLAFSFLKAIASRVFSTKMICGWVLGIGVVLGLLRLAGNYGYEKWRSSSITVAFDDNGNVTSLEIYTRAELSRFGPLPKLEKLILPFGDADISKLANSPGLKELHLGGANVRDLSPLSSLVNLERLNVSQTAVKDISPLANLKALEELDLTHTQVRDISPLQSLTLKWLDIRRTDVSDITPLKNQAALRHLALPQGVRDISCLSELKNLESLNLLATEVADVSALSRLSNLRTLLLGSKVEDLSPIADLPRLQTLELDSGVSDTTGIAIPLPGK